MSRCRTQSDRRSLSWRLAPLCRQCTPSLNGSIAFICPVAWRSLALKCMSPTASAAYFDFLFAFIAHHLFVALSDRFMLGGLVSNGVVITLETSHRIVSHLSHLIQVKAQIGACRLFHRHCVRHWHRAFHPIVWINWQVSSRTLGSFPVATETSNEVFFCSSRIVNGASRL